MLEKPDLTEQLILTSIHDEYGLHPSRLAFLPLGADANTAVYRLETQAGQTCFLKLRSGAFDETSVMVPKFLHSQGLRFVIPPLETRSGRLWCSLGDFKLILYPFIEADESAELGDRQWLEFGAALKRLHRLPMPPELEKLLQRELFSPKGREAVQAFQRQVEQEGFAEPVAARFAASMRAKRAEIDHLVRRAGELALALQARPLEFVLCHSDVHAWNLLITTRGELYIVDWDHPILAPKERDLMFIGGGVSAALSSESGEALFYQAYGPAEIDRTALAYYRYERIVQDIYEFGKQLLSSEAGGEDREQAYRWFMSNFLPGNTLEIALQTDRL